MVKFIAHNFLFPAQEVFCRSKFTPSRPNWAPTWRAARRLTAAVVLPRPPPLPAALAAPCATCPPPPCSQQLRSTPPLRRPPRRPWITVHRESRFRRLRSTNRSQPTQNANQRRPRHFTQPRSLRSSRRSLRSSRRSHRSSRRLRRSNPWRWRWPSNQRTRRTSP
jgi:hypothetical protein